MYKRGLKAALACVTTCMTTVAAAGVTTIDFNQATPCVYINPSLHFGSACNTPYVEDGFKMQVVSGHFDLMGPGPTDFDGTNWMGIDNGIAANELGFPSRVRLTQGAGQRFSLLSLDAHFVASTHVASSKGGDFLFSSPRIFKAMVDFSGSQWTDVEWLEFYEPSGVGKPFGFDNIRVQVPEPPSLLLAALAFLGLAIARWRHTPRD